MKTRRSRRRKRKIMANQIMSGNYIVMIEKCYIINRKRQISHFPFDRFEKIMLIESNSVQCTINSVSLPSVDSFIYSNHVRTKRVRLYTKVSKSIQFDMFFCCFPLAVYVRSLSRGEGLVSGESDNIIYVLFVVSEWISTTNPYLCKYVIDIFWEIPDTFFR